MIQCAARRACATSLKKGRLCQWRVSGNARPPCRSRSAGPIAASEVWSNPERGSSIVSASIQEQERERERDAADEKDAESMETEHMFDRTPTALGRDVGRMVRSNQDFLQPEVVDLVIRASKGATGLSSPPGVQSGVDVFAAVAKAYRRLKRQHLTLHLCEAFEESTGEPLVPSTPGGLVLLLDAMKPKTSRHARRPGESAAKRDLGGERAVKELLRRYEAWGKGVPISAYKAAVRALDGPDCMVALDMAREARSKLGDSAEGLGEVYALVMRQCQERQAADVMRLALEERRDAGGNLAPDRHAYASTLGCFGKAKRVAETLEVFGDMLEAGVKPDAIAVNHLLAACARDADDYWMHAKTLFEGMEKRWGLAPNVYHFTSLVTCLLKADQWSEAIAMTDKMEDEGITPNARFLDHLMQASVGAKQWVTAEAIFRAMTEKYGHSNVVTRQSTFHFVQSMVMQKKLRKVIAYVARVQDFSLKGPSPKGQGHGSLDAALLRWFKTIPGVGSEALVGVLMTMQDKGVRLHPDAYSVVIAKANQDGNKELSETLYKMLLAGNGAPSLSASNAAIKGCTSIDEALEIMASLGEHGLSADTFTYAALLRCCSNAVDDERQAQRATQVWEAMVEEGIVPHGGMLASYLLALMRSSDWELAVEVRERYRNGSEELSHAERHVDKLDFVTREDAVVDGVMANGLVDNGQPDLALAYVLQVVEARAQEQETACSDGTEEEMKRFVDEDNHTVLAGIRACKETGSCETAMALLEACEARWAKGPLAPEAEADRGRERGDGGEGARYEWREMLVRTRLSRRRLYDCLVSVLDEKGHDFGEIRRVLEKGMKNGALSLMKDQLGGTSGEQAVDFHGWSTMSARCIVRCIVQDLARGKDFLLEMGQYDLGRVASAQGLREFGDVSERWHVDSPDPRGRRREFADGVTPARFAEREYGKGRKRTSEYSSRWERPVGGWDGKGADLTQARWWEKEKRLSLIVGKPRPPPCIRNTVEEFCTLGVTPPLRVRKDASNPGILTIEPEDVHVWLEREPAILS